MSLGEAISRVDEVPLNSEGFGRVAILRSARSALMESDAPIVVIGCTGWIGRATLDVLAATLGQEAFERRVSLFGSTDRSIKITQHWSAPCYALTEWRSYRAPSALIFHNSFLTRDKIAGMPLLDYVAANRKISDQVAAICEAWTAQALFLPSSGAVYNADGLLESDLEANPYGLLKVEDEQRFSGLMAGRAYVAPRIFGLSGEYINKTDTYALADIIRQLRLTGEISLRAKRPVYRSYLYIGDLIGLAFHVMLDLRREHRTFDTAGSEIVEVGELAQRICRLLGHSDAQIHRDRDEAAAADRYVGNFAALGAVAAEYDFALLSLDKQVMRTAQFLSSQALN